MEYMPDLAYQSLDPLYHHGAIKTAPRKMPSERAHPSYLARPKQAHSPGELSSKIFIPRNGGTLLKDRVGALYATAAFGDMPLMILNARNLWVPRLSGGH